MGRDRGDLASLERCRSSTGARRHSHPHSVADSSHVVLSHPLTQLHDAWWQKRLAVQYLDDVLDRIRVRRLRTVRDDATGHRARANGHADPRSGYRRLEMIGNSVGEAVEEGNGDCDGDVVQLLSCQYRPDSLHVFPDLTL